MTQDEDSESMRNEIAEMKQEALRRIEALNLQISPAPQASKTRTISEEDKSATKNNDVRVEKSASDAVEHPSRVGISSSPPEKSNLSKTSESAVSFDTPSAQIERDELSLLDNTNWKIMLNVGREEGTSVEISALFCLSILTFLILTIALQLARSFRKMHQLLEKVHGCQKHGELVENGCS